MKTKKTFKVVMLPTKQKALIYTDRHGNLKPHSTESTLPLDSIGSNFHLYIISDDEIKEGDWCFYRNQLGGGNFICQAYKHPNDKRMLFDDGTFNRTTGSGITPLEGECKKIVATTDTSLNDLIGFDSKIQDTANIGLPQIPESFIQAYIKVYNEGKPITEVDLEMEIGNWEHHDNVHRRCVNCNTINHKLEEYNCVCTKNVKTRSDNTVIVHQRKMYTRDEVIAFAKKYAARCQAPIQSTKWLEENL